jgi:hypothetical protein
MRGRMQVLRIDWANAGTRGRNPDLAIDRK